MELDNEYEQTSQASETNVSKQNTNTKASIMQYD